MEIEQIISELEQMVSSGGRCLCGHFDPCSGACKSVSKKEIIDLITRIKYNCKIVPQPVDESNSRLKKYVQSILEKEL